MKNIWKNIQKIFKIFKNYSKEVAFSPFRTLSCSHLTLSCLKPLKRTFLKLDRALKPKERLHEGLLVSAKSANHVPFRAPSARANHTLAGAIARMAWKNQLHYGKSFTGVNLTITTPFGFTSAVNLSWYFPRSLCSKRSRAIAIDEGSPTWN